MWLFLFKCCPFRGWGLAPGPLNSLLVLLPVILGCMSKTPVWLQSSVNKSYVDLLEKVPTPGLRSVPWDGWGGGERLAKTIIIPHFKMHLTRSFEIRPEFKKMILVTFDDGKHSQMHVWVMRLAVPFWHCPLWACSLAVANGSSKSGWKYKRARGQVSPPYVHPSEASKPPF